MSDAPADTHPSSPQSQRMSFKPYTLILFLAFAATCVVRFILSGQGPMDTMAIGGAFALVSLIALVAGAIAAAIGRKSGRATGAFNVAVSIVLLGFLALMWFYLIRGFLAPPPAPRPPDAVDPPTRRT